MSRAAAARCGAIEIALRVQRDAAGGVAAIITIGEVVQVGVSPMTGRPQGINGPPFSNLKVVSVFRIQAPFLFFI
jgi:hypothetical protein